MADSHEAQRFDEADRFDELADIGRTLVAELFPVQQTNAGHFDSQRKKIDLVCERATREICDPSDRQEPQSIVIKHGYVVLNGGGEFADVDYHRPLLGFFERLTVDSIPVPGVPEQVTTQAAFVFRPLFGQPGADPLERLHIAIESIAMLGVAPLEHPLYLDGCYFDSLCFEALEDGSTEDDPLLFEEKVSDAASKVSDESPLMGQRVGFLLQPFSRTNYYEHYSDIGQSVAPKRAFHPETLVVQGTLREYIGGSYAEESGTSDRLPRLSALVELDNGTFVELDTQQIALGRVLSDLPFTIDPKTDYFHILEYFDTAIKDEYSALLAAGKREQAQTFLINLGTRLSLISRLVGTHVAVETNEDTSLVSTYQQTLDDEPLIMARETVDIPYGYSVGAIVTRWCGALGEHDDPELCLGIKLLHPLFIAQGAEFFMRAKALNVLRVVLDPKLN